MAASVKSFWWVQTRRPFATEVILPKSNIDLLFNFGAPLRLTLGHGGHFALLPGAWIAGLQVRAIVSQPQGEVHLFGVSFAVERCPTLFPFSLHEITGVFLGARDVFDDADLLAERLHAVPAFERRIEVLFAWLKLRYEPATPHHRLVGQACDRLAEATTSADLQELARSFGFSSRHLRRLFLTHVGVTPGHYLRLNRFVRALDLMTANRSLTEVAHAASYFDQAHFCRDFRELSGLTPGDYRARCGPAVGHVFAS